MTPHPSAVGSNNEQEREDDDIAKRGGRALQAAAFNVYVWAFNRFMQNPEIDA